MKIEDFFTKDLHSKAKKLKLYNPDYTDSGEHLMVYGFDSGEARSAYAEAERMGFKDLGQGIDVDVDYLKLYHIQSFIKSWSFDLECSTENKIELLSGAPYIADVVKVFAQNHENFAKKSKR